MTIAEVSALVVSIGTLVSAIASLVVATRTARKVAETHELVNGQSHALSAAIAAASRAEGIQAGVDQERDRPPS